MGKEEPEQLEEVYITNLEDGLRKDGTALYDEKGPNEKKACCEKQAYEVPSLTNPNHVFDIYGDSDSDVIYIEDFSKGETRKNPNNTTTLTNKKVAELKTVRDESTTKKDNVESAMMCWESTESLVEKEHREEPEKMANKLVETTEKQKHEEEHVEPTLNTSN